MLFSILIFDEPGTGALRDEFRQRHLDYLKSFDDQTLFAGPFTADDESADLGSLRLIELPNLAAAEKHIADEPYVTGGVQKRWLINRWKPSIVTTWRDCHRTKGNIQLMFHAIDSRAGADIRKRNEEALEAYLDQHTNSIMCRGLLLSDKGAAPIGSLMLLDVTDLGAGRAIIENEPLFKAGCYQDITLHRWRFGRVFDRYKD
ncbi:MAG: YciI family protein [Boseongicola sp.]